LNPRNPENRIIPTYPRYHRPIVLPQRFCSDLCRRPIQSGRLKPLEQLLPLKLDSQKADNMPEVTPADPGVQIRNDISRRKMPGNDRLEDQ